MISQSVPNASYHPALEYAGGAVGGLYDLRLWRTHLFQDAAATTPVTASGQLVGCIKTCVGSTNWDLIQSDNSRRPTFEIINGVPQITLGTSKNLYARTNQTMEIPVYLCGGFSFDGTISRAIFGFVKNDGTFFYLRPETLGRASTNANGVTPSRPWLFAYPPNFSCPEDTPHVLDTMISTTGSLSITVDGQAQVAGLSPTATAWVDTDSVASMTLNLNGSSESLDIGQPNSDLEVVFFGGMVLMGEPSNRAGCAAFFKDQIDAIEIRPQDKVVCIIGDSTGDDILTATFEEEMFRALVVDEIVPDNPNASVFYRRWVRAGGYMTAWERMSTGATDARIFVSNTSSAGSQPSYMIASRWNPIIRDLHPHIDEFIVNHGHNFAFTGTDANGWVRRGEWAELFDKMRAEYPETPILPIRTYPADTGDNRILPVVLALDALATQYGDMTPVDIYDHFETNGRPDAWYQSDDVHPSIPTGVDEALSILAPAYNAWQSAKPSFIAKPLIDARPILKSENVLANPLFDDAGGSVIDSWTLTGSGTAAKAFDYVDEGDGYSVKLDVTTGNVYITQSFNAIPYRNKAVWFAIRMYIPEAVTNLEAGQIRLSSDGTGNVGASWIASVSGQPKGAWIWRYHALPPLPNDATTASIEIWAGSASGASIRLGRAIGFAGSGPRNILT